MRSEYNNLHVDLIGMRALAMRQDDPVSIVVFVLR